MVEIRFQVFATITLTMLLQWGLGSAFHMEVAYDKTAGMVDNKVKISCYSDDMSFVAKRIIILEVGKEGEKPIAILGQNSDITNGETMQKNFKVHGYLRKNKTQNFLQLVITNPELKDFGEYACVMFYLNDLGNMAEERAKANVTLDNLDVTGLVHQLLNKVSDLESTVLEQKDKIKQQEKNCKDQMDTLQYDLNNTLANHIRQQENWNKLQGASVLDLKQQEDNFKDQTNALQYDLVDLNNTLGTHIRDQENWNTLQDASVLDLKQQLKDHQHEIIKNKTAAENPMVAFSAAYQGTKDVIRQNKVLIFEKVLFETGGGYDKDTGFFTAPHGGLYVFHLVITTKGSGYHAEVDILANGKPVARTWVRDNDFQDQSSSSTVLQLVTGDIVKAFARSSGSEYLDASSNLKNVFTGYLIHAL